MRLATTSAPTSAPTSGLLATSSPATAPVKASSLVPCTAKAMERVMTNGPMQPAAERHEERRLEGVLGEAELEEVADAHQCRVPRSVVGVAARLGGQLVLGAHHEVAVPHLDHVDLDAVEVGQALAGQDLAGGARWPSARDQVEDAVDIGQDGVHLVGHEDDGGPAAAPALVDQAGHGALAGQVEGQEGLVAQEHGRVTEQRLGDAQALLLAARESPTGASRVGARAHRLDELVQPGPGGPVGAQRHAPAATVDPETDQVAGPDGQALLEGALLGDVAERGVAPARCARR